MSGPRSVWKLSSVYGFGRRSDVRSNDFLWSSSSLLSRFANFSLYFLSALASFSLGCVFMMTILIFIPIVLCAFSAVAFVFSFDFAFLFAAFVFFVLAIALTSFSVLYPMSRYGRGE